MIILARGVLADGTKVMAVDHPGEAPSWSGSVGRIITDHTDAPGSADAFYVHRYPGKPGAVWHWIVDQEKEVAMGTCMKTTMRRFILQRDEDATGTSGTGVIAEGVEYSNGQASLHWLTQLESVAVYANVKVLEAIHGHEGKTKVVWLDK